MAIETSYRSFSKAISYRVLSTLITAGIVFGVTGKGELAFAVAGFDSLIKVLSYYLHERAWVFVRFGLVEGPPDEVEVPRTHEIGAVLPELELSERHR
ncbi:MAG: DUF2061 domain-containing protein [Acidobacteria bacterium]|nr:DUF2061 domain-containing protein [Acidobacteriota bacterium]